MHISYLIPYLISYFCNSCVFLFSFSFSHLVCNFWGRGAEVFGSGRQHHDTEHPWKTAVCAWSECYRLHAEDQGGEVKRYFVAWYQTDTSPKYFIPPKWQLILEHHTVFNSFIVAFDVNQHLPKKSVAVFFNRTERPTLPPCFLMRSTWPVFAMD